MKIQQNLAKCEVGVYAATMSNPDDFYFGRSRGKGLNAFKGKKGYWTVWDDGETNAARLVIDENGKPADFIPRIFSDGSVYGYVRK